MDANANQADETNGQASQIWTKTVYGWQQKGFRAMREKQSCLQKVKRIKCPKGNKQTCDLGCARYPRQNKARDEHAAESLLRIGDLIAKFLNSLLTNLIVQLLIEFLRASCS